MKFAPLVIRNLLRNPRRTILSVLSIGISIFIFAALMSLPAVVAEILRDRVSALRLLVANKAGIGYPLPAAYGVKIGAMPHVDAFSGYLVEVASYRGPKEMVAIAGVDPETIPVIWPDWGTSAAAVPGLLRARSSGVVSESLMKRFNWKVGDKVTLHGITTPAELSFTIVGTLGDRGPEDAVLVPLERLSQMEGDPGRVILYFVKLDRSEFAETVIREIDDRFANSPAETETQTELGVAQHQVRDLRLLFVGVKLIAVIIVMVIVMVAANTAAMAVRERRHELAVMRSIGFTRAALVTLLIVEGLTMGAAAGALGCAIAYGVLKIAGSNLLGPGLVVYLMPRVAVGSIGVAAAIGLLSAAIPALLATRRDISAALRAT